MSTSTGANASTRLRRTFHYPSDNSDSDPEAMDEEEQETLITKLTAENASRNSQFRLILLSLPLLSILPYIPLLFRSSTALLSLLSLTSLLSTAWLLYNLPPGSTGLGHVDAWTKGEDVRAATREARSVLLGQRSPLQVWLPYLNLGLGVVIMLLGLVGAGRDVWFGWVGMCYLPILVHVTVIVSKVVMGSVDPERELGKLKYHYKGA